MTKYTLSMLLAMLVVLASVSLRRTFASVGDSQWTQAMTAVGSSPIPLPPKQLASVGSSPIPLPPKQLASVGSSPIPLPPKQLDGQSS